MPTHAPESRTAEVRIRDLVEGSLSTRASGAAAYPVIVRYLASLRDVYIVLTFRDVDFVSPSFLDETIVRLLEEVTELRGRLAVADLAPPSSRALRLAMEARHVPEAALVIR